MKIWSLKYPYTPALAETSHPVKGKNFKFVKWHGLPASYSGNKFGLTIFFFLVNFRLRHQRREVEERHEPTFEEVVHVSNSNEAANHGLVNESDEIVQQHQNVQGGQDMNVSIEDGSMSSMASSRHSYDTRSLPKGNQITIDQRPDLLK